MKSLLFTLALIITVSQTEANTYQNGFVLLREGIGARAAAMGDAYTAITGDQTAAYWNPAGVAALTHKDFILSHHRSFQGINQAYGGWAFGNGKRGLAFSLTVNAVGGLETRTAPTADPLGTFSVYGLNTGLSYAQHIGSRAYVGFNIRALHENIGPESAWGSAADIGLIYRLTPQLTLGIAYRNLGRMETLEYTRTPLPRTLRIGTAFTHNTLTLSADFRLPQNAPKGLNLGLEYTLKNHLFLRGGYRTNHDTRDLSFGLGLTRKNWRIDYAFVPSTHNLGTAHRIAVGIR